MPESLSGRFPRFIWSDPTRPFANASLRLTGAVSQLPDAPRASGLVQTITAMAGHLRAWGESRESALAAIHQELEIALTADQPPGQAWSPAMIDEVVSLAVDSCYGAPEPPRMVSSPKPPARKGRSGESPRRRGDSKRR